MSALPPKADIAECYRDVRFVPKKRTCAIAAISGIDSSAPLARRGFARTCSRPYLSGRPSEAREGFVLSVAVEPETAGGPDALS
jgi:hypothetical protein